MKFMRRNSVALAAMAAGILTTTLPVAAHHSAASAYDSSRKVEAQGSMTKALLKNPHSFVFLESTDEKGQKIEWQIELGAWSGLSTQGWTKEMFVPGTVVKVTGNPSRAPGSHGMTGARFTRPDGTPFGPTGRADPAQ